MDMDDNIKLITLNNFKKKLLFQKIGISFINETLG